MVLMILVMVLGSPESKDIMKKIKIQVNHNTKKTNYLIPINHRLFPFFWLVGTGIFAVAKGSEFLGALCLLIACLLLQEKDENSKK